MPFLSDLHRILFLMGLLVSLTGHGQKLRPEIGIAHSLDQDSLLYASGYWYVVENVQDLFSPVKVTDEQFEKNLARIHKAKLKIYAVNVFIPGELKLVGPDVDEAKILLYCERVFQRCQSADIKMIVWGSGGARKIPDGFDRSKAKEQFIAIAKKVAAMAARFNVMLALENLNSSETNFINTVAEALTLVKAVDHANFKLCADIYHMLRENESPAIIEQAGKHLIHVDIAEKNNRNAPTSEDFTPYLRALKKINYKGKIIIEGRWENLEKQAAASFVFLQKQIGKVYNARQ
jgi:sugar phosphate isomerase/epimerase